MGRFRTINSQPTNTVGNIRTILQYLVEVTLDFCFSFLLSTPLLGGVFFKWGGLDARKVLVSLIEIKEKCKHYYY